ncbi:hypothetical protein T4C_2943 [Trichinella pseudospiralis]|uniref:Uncharacterized protein n=1 Tax=Trichinella pseudospiralis TaxID=6337 RepID=A0A0V1K3K3_TRIPS|nr:hypothetical protein T4C_2943 [Trichinella pseudospiralis]
MVAATVPEEAQSLTEPPLPRRRLVFLWEVVQRRDVVASPFLQGEAAGSHQVGELLHQVASFSAVVTTGRQIVHAHVREDAVDERVDLSTLPGMLPHHLHGEERRTRKTESHPRQPVGLHWSLRACFLPQETADVPIFRAEADLQVHLLYVCLQCDLGAAESQKDGDQVRLEAGARFQALVQRGPAECG